MKVITSPFGGGGGGQSETIMLSGVASAEFAMDLALANELEISGNLIGNGSSINLQFYVDGAWVNTGYTYRPISTNGTSIVTGNSVQTGIAIVVYSIISIQECFKLNILINASSVFAVGEAMNTTQFAPIGGYRALTAHPTKCRVWSSANLTGTLTLTKKR